MSDQITVTHRVWTVPNAISALRLLLVPVFGILIWQHMDLWALLVLAISGATDWLDGVIARRFNQVTRLGQLLDPTADRLYIFVTLVGLSARDIIPWWLLILIALRELVLGVNLLVLRKHGYGPPPVHFIGKAGTFMLLYAFPLLLLGSLSGPIGAIGWTVGWAFAIWGVGLYWLAGLMYIRQTQLLIKPAVAKDT